MAHLAPWQDKFTDALRNAELAMKSAQLSYENGSPKANVEYMIKQAVRHLRSANKINEAG